MPVHVSPVANLSALGAAHLAGLVAQWWDLEALEAGPGATDPSRLDLQPRITSRDRALLRARWDDAVHRVRRSPDRHELETIS